VGSYPLGASPYGVLDMAGNVWEWVSDWHSDTYYSASPYLNPTGPLTGTYRVHRGGSFSLEYDLRTASRSGSGADAHFSFIGFRCAASVP
jgi:formylglycine-generating enzyme required for sulfatase activity